MKNIAPIKLSIERNNFYYFRTPSAKIKILVDALRLVSNDNDIIDRTLYIPDECEKYGFTEGYHNLGQLLHFLADMLEE